MMLLGLCFTAPLLANEVLRIESQAAEYSAQIYIQEEEKGSVPEKEKENDQKRKKLGIGETVFLILVSDKPQLIGDPSQIEWTIEEGENLASFQNKSNSVIQTLIIRNDLSQGGDITVKQSRKKEEKRKSRYQPLFPKGSAQNIYGNHMTEIIRILIKEESFILICQRMVIKKWQGHQLSWN